MEVIEDLRKRLRESEDEKERVKKKHKNDFNQLTERVINLLHEQKDFQRCLGALQ